MAGDFENDAIGDATLATGTSDADLIADAGDGSNGKHLVLFVPDFSNTAEAVPGPISNANNAPMNSYLRLGMADSRAGDKTQVALGEDLAALVLGFTDDFRDRGDPNGGQGADAPDQANVARNAGILTGAAAGSGTPYAEPPTSGPDFRQPESLQLHTKGGWRDHSDGNRITTTRGDKVEVIRGNYKLLVLGRNDDIGNAVGFDMSGGQVDTDGGDLARPNAADIAAGAASGLDMTWQWKSDSDGNFRWHVTTLQGGTGTVDGDASTASNPSMLTQTWAYDVTSDTTANTITTNTTTTGDKSRPPRATAGRSPRRSTQATRSARRRSRRQQHHHDDR